MQTHFLSDKRVMTFFFLWSPPRPRGRICQLLVAESQCSGPCHSLRRLHVIRVHLTLTLYRAWTWWSPKKIKKRSLPSCRTENESAQPAKGSFHHGVYIQTSVSLWYRLILPLICSRTEILFENQMIFISNFLFENRIV